MGLDAGKVVAYLTLDTTKFESGIATGRTLIKTLSSDSATAAKKALAIGDAMESTGKAMTLGLTVPIVGLGIAATSTFASFDDAIRQVTATMEASTEETARLTEAAKEIGLTTQFSATQAAEALNSLAAAGYDTEKAIAALPVVLKLSAAAGIDLESAASMLTDSMSSLGLGVADMESFVDQMAKGASVSNASIAQLGEAILTVGGTAKILKGGTVELNAQLGILANNGLKGAEGGTMLRNVINALSAPTDQAAAAMKKYGITAFDADGNFRGLNETMLDLSGVMDGWSDEKRAALMSELFNVRDLKAAEAMMSGASTLYADFSNQIANSKGAAQRFADTLSGGLSGSMDKLKAAVQGLGIEFGEDLAPSIQGVADWVTNLTRNWASMDEGMQQTVLTVAGVVAAVGPALIIMGKLTTAVTSISMAMTGPAGWITLAVVGVAALGIALAGLPAQADAVDEALAKVDPERVAAFKKGLDSIAVDVTVTATAKVNAGTIYDQIYAALTDGKPDTAKQTKELQGSVQGYYDGLIGAINLDTETKLKGLKEQLEGGFITLEDYQTRAESITNENGTLIASVQSTCNDTLAYITTMSEKSTATVQGSLDEMEALKTRAEELAAQVSKLAEEAASAESKRAQRLVKAGVKTDDETTGLAFTGVKAQYQVDTYDAEQNAAGRRKAADQKFDEASKNASGPELERLKAEHDAQVAEIEKELAADKARIQAGYLQSLNELFAGLAGQNPELQTKLAGAFEKLDIAAALQKALENGTPGEVTKNTALMDRLGKALGIDDPTSFLQSFENTGDVSGLADNINSYIGRLVEAAGTETSGLDTSPMATAMQGLIDEGLLAGFNFDNASTRDKLALALGQMDLPQTIADAMSQAYTNRGPEGTAPTALEVPMTVTPAPTVAEDASEKTRKALEIAILQGGTGGSEKDKEAPTVDVPVSVTADPVVKEGSGQKLVDAVAGAISDAVGTVTSAGQSISKAAATAFSSETSTAKTAGGDMIQGLIDGANDKKATLIATFEALMLAAILAAKRKAGIASPSKVFRGIGQNIADSFALGVDERLFASQKSVERLVQAPGSTAAGTQRAAQPSIDYDRLAQASSSRPVNLYVNGKLLAQATASDNTTAIAARQRRIDIGKGVK